MRVRNSTLMLFVMLFVLYGAMYPESQVFGHVTYELSTRTKVVALTFDDGPNGKYTEEVLDILDQEGVKGTFFLVGANVEAYPDVARDIARRGHVIGNHSYHHTWAFPFHSRSAVIKEVDQSDAAIFRAIGRHTKLFRPPHGLRTPWMIGATKSAGYQVVDWDDMTTDYSPSTTTADIVHTLVKDARPGAIIVLHDGLNLEHGANRQNSVDALRAIIRKLKAQGYTFTTL